MFPEWQSVLSRVALETSLRVILVAASVGFVLLVARVRHAGTRHAAWTLVLLSMILMPALPRLVPEIRIPPFVPLAQGSLPFEPAIAPLPSLEQLRPQETTPGVLFDAAPDAAAASAMTRADTAPVAPASSRPLVSYWPAAVLGVYLCGFCFLLARLLTGWRFARRVVEASRPIEDGPGASARMYESRQLATPVTIGPLAPKVVLPAGWRDWPDDMRRAAVAHELAHVRRRDPLVALLAHLNRCVFWFHPLAWWLERKLAATSEDACDEAAVQTLGEPRQYARMLLEMADTVRRRGQRVAWQGVGVDGSGLLGRRIDRVLSGEVFGEVSMLRKVVVAVTCATAVFLVVACRQQAARPAAAPLQPDPAVAERLVGQKAQTEQYQATMKMTREQVAGLEAALQKNPEDLEARGKLLTFYRFGGPKGTPWNEAVSARRRHILWMIEHHPDGYRFDGWGTIDPRYDPDGFAQAKKLWLAATAKPDVDLKILSNAVYFFARTDKPLAEQQLLRGQKRDPGGPQPRAKDNVYYASWSSRLGSLYASAIVGMIDPIQATTSEAEARSPFAQEARSKLDASADAAMLQAAGWDLVQRYGRRIVSVDPDAGSFWVVVHQGRKVSVDELGKSYLERAAKLDPKSEPLVRRFLFWQATADRTIELSTRLKGVPREKQADIILALPDAERLALLPQRTEGEYMYAEYLDYVRHESAAAKASWEQTRKYAGHLLNLAGRMRDDPNSSRGLFAAHVTLGALALHDGDAAAALKHADEAGQVPASDTLRLDIDMMWMRLAVGLLKRGEYEATARFLDRYAALNEAQRERLTKDAAAIRAGRMPEFYQYQVARP